MKIVLLDGEALNPGDLSWAPLEALGQLTVYPRGTNDQQEVIRRIGDAEIVLCNKTPVGRTVFEQCPNMKLLCVVATGYNVVDTQAAKDHGVPVCNVPAYGTEMVAQFAIGLLLELCHHVELHNASVHAGEWERCPNFCYWKTPIMELAGKTMGIIGFGRIGRAVGRIAKAMGMKILATGSRPCDEGLAIAEYVDLDTVLRDSDVISLHCPRREHRHDQPGHPRQNEGRRHPDQQQPGRPHRRAGRGRRPEQRQAPCRRRGCGDGGAHCEQQSPADRQKLRHHPPYVLGRHRMPPTDRGYHRRQYQRLPGRVSPECGKSVIKRHLLPWCGFERK